MRRFLPVAAAALAATSCGYIGGTQPPLANVPSSVADLTAFQRGPLILAQFTVPTQTTEGIPIKAPLTIDLRIGGAATGGFNPAIWAEGATRIAEPPAATKTIPAPVGKRGRPAKRGKQAAIAKSEVQYQIATAQWTGRDVTIAVRVIGENGKESEWSNFLNLRVIPPPEKPAQVIATDTANGVHLSWRAAGQHFRVFRKAAPADDFTLLAEPKAPEYLDSAAEFGKTYTYQIQTIADPAGGKEAESDLSEPVTRTPIDKFPPAPPTGLRVTATPDSVELSWESNPEPDLAGYRVYRSAGGGAFEKIADVSAIPAYSDQKVERGKTYRYAVAAIDKSNNESDRSAVAEVALR